MSGVYVAYVADVDKRQLGELTLVCFFKRSLCYKKFAVMAGDSFSCFHTIQSTKTQFNLFMVFGRVRERLWFCCYAYKVNIDLKWEIGLYYFIDM